MVLFAGVLLACPLHAAVDQGSSPFRIMAHGSFCDVLHSLTSDQPLPLHPLFPAVSQTAIGPRTGVLFAWLLTHSVEHPPG
jgi:hypothetical protein